MFVIPKTKQMASRIFDLPLPFSPVMELKDSSLRMMVSSLPAVVDKRIEIQKIAVDDSP
jgi:hypothetical protein